MEVRAFSRPGGAKRTGRFFCYLVSGFTKSRARNLIYLLLSFAWSLSRRIKKGKKKKENNLLSRSKRAYRRRTLGWSAREEVAGIHSAVVTVDTG